MNIPEEWMVKSLSDVVEIQRGFDLPHNARRPGPYPVLTAGETGGFHDEGPIKGPGVTIGRATNLGKPKWSDVDFWPHNTTMFVKDFKGNSRRWVYHLFEATDLSGFDSGSVQPMLNRNYIAHVQVRVPPFQEQVAIAEVLGALDDKIATNTKVATSAHDLLQARWNDIVFSGHSSIEWKSIGSLGTVVTGKTPPTSDKGNYEGETPFVTVADMRTGIYVLHTRRTLSRSGVSSVQKALLPAGAVLMSCIATVGEVSITTQPSVTNQQINALIPRGNIDPTFAYLGFCHVGRELDNRGSGGSVYTNVSKSVFSSIEIPMLPHEQQRQAVAGLDELELSMRMQNRTLTAIRDALLPQLMSGKLQIKDAETLVAGRV